MRGLCAVAAEEPVLVGLVHSLEKEPHLGTYFFCSGINETGTTAVNSSYRASDSTALATACVRGTRRILGEVVVMTTAPWNSTEMGQECSSPNSLETITHALRPYILYN